MMRCSYCYLALRLRLPCPCSLYQSSGQTSPPPASPSYVIEQKEKDTVGETERKREGEKIAGSRGRAHGLNQFQRIAPVQLPMLYWGYPASLSSPSFYFGENSIATTRIPAQSQPKPIQLELSAFGSVSRGTIQAHREMAEVPSTMERVKHDSITREQEPLPLQPYLNTVSTAENTGKEKLPNHENAWRGPTYTELITEAILSTPEHRMTLSQIYDWITENVEYFRERKNFTSAKGWKNAIRHTLSLRKRFVRVARTTGAASWYNSWWMVNEKQMNRRRGKSKSIRKATFSSYDTKA